MSLKAKIEAVIYASEEPVTLAQLVGLLGQEAQAELDALVSQQQSLALPEFGPVDDLSIPDQDALNAETLDVSETESEVSDEEPAVSEDAASELFGSQDLSARPEPASSADPVESAADEPPAEAALDSQTSDDKAAALAAKQKDRLLRDYFRSLLDELIRDYSSDARGLEVREVAGGFRLGTKPEYHDAVRGFVKSLKPPLKLSLQALETLAVIAYKQPVTAPEISEIRGVDSAGVLGSLMARKLVTTAGRKQVIGRPILYKTTKDFLLRFGLKDLKELPSIEEFEKMAGELNAQEEIPMDAASDEPDSPILDERNATPEPTHIHHDSPEDLMSDRSDYLEGHNREHNDPHEVEPQPRPQPQADSQPELDSQPERKSQLRAEDEEGFESEADEVIVDGRISGLPPDYSDDSPSAEDARAQEQQEDPEQ